MDDLLFTPNCPYCLVPMVAHGAGIEIAWRCLASGRGGSRLEKERPETRGRAHHNTCASSQEVTLG